MQTEHGANTVIHREEPGHKSTSPAPLMEAVLAEHNMQRAYRRVVANKGAPGIDGMTVQQLVDHLKQQWPTLSERLLAGASPTDPCRCDSQA